MRRQSKQQPGLWEHQPDLQKINNQWQWLGGYSSLVKTPDNMIGALIEFNENTSDSDNSHRSIYFHKFNLAWITQ